MIVNCLLFSAYLFSVELAAMTWSEEWKEERSEKIPLPSSVAATGSSAASIVAQSLFKHMAWINFFFNFEHFIFWHVTACLRQGEGCRRYIFNIVAPFIPHRLHPPCTEAPVQSVTVTFLWRTQSSSGLSVLVDSQCGIAANSLLRALELHTSAYVSWRDQRISSLPLTVLKMWSQVWISMVSHVTRPVKLSVWIWEMV